MSQSRIKRLNRLGARLTQTSRDQYANCARSLRDDHRILSRRRTMAHCDLLELADDLSTLASPIVVTRKKYKP